MAEWGIIGMHRPESEERESSREGSAEDRPPDAEEIERVVDVAEWLGISPAVAAAALRRDGKRVRADVPLTESIRYVEHQLRRET